MRQSKGHAILKDKKTRPLQIHIFIKLKRFTATFVANVVADVVDNDFVATTAAAPAAYAAPIIYACVRVRAKCPWDQLTSKARQL